MKQQPQTPLIQLGEQTKCVIITSGGTSVPIDDVRSITNISHGTLGAHLAEAALGKGWHVVYIHAEHAKLPQTGSGVGTVSEQQLRCVSYKTFDDYHHVLRSTIESGIADAVFLAAAVSDYSPVPASGKLSSQSKSLTMTLTRNPKLIKQVRTWSPRPIFQVGFKLLSDVGEAELFETAYRACISNGSHLTIANDLSDIRAGQRKVLIVTPEKGKIAMSGESLAKDIFDFFERRFCATHMQTVIRRDMAIAVTYRQEVNRVKESIRSLYSHGLLEEFYAGAGRHHGSVAVRTADGFLITARSSDKSNIQDDDITHVDSVDTEEHRLQARSINLKKPSMNALLCHMIFTSRPEVNIIVHTHRFIEHAPSTDFAFTPGTLEYAEAAVATLGSGDDVNLRDHGHISVGTNEEEVLRHVQNHAT